MYDSVILLYSGKPGRNCTKCNTRKGANKIKRNLIFQLLKTYLILLLPFPERVMVNLCYFIQEVNLSVS